jgi:exonuclease III
MENLSIAFWNIDGIFMRNGNGCQRICKLDVPEIATDLTKFDIICLAETHSSASDELALNDYSVIQNNRKKTGKSKKCYGCIATLIKSNLKQGVKIISPSNSEIQWLKISKKFFNLTSDIYLCTAYASPSGSNFVGKEDLDIFEILENDISQYSKLGQCFICGDFNARTANLTSVLMMTYLSI